MGNSICGFDGYEITEYGRVLSLKSCEKVGERLKNNEKRRRYNSWENVAECLVAFVAILLKRPNISLLTTAEK